MDESLGHSYVSLADSHSFVAQQTDEVKVTCLGRSHRQAEESTSQ